MTGTGEGFGMSGLTLKRLMVVIVSQILGGVLTFLLIGPGFDLLGVLLQIPAIRGVTPATYGTLYFLVTSIPIGITLMIWMDQFVDSRILPD
jgi:hypothetical protein